MNTSNYPSFFLYNLLFMIFFCLLLILMVAYFTLFERKIISMTQRRNGPDSVGFFGLLQPIADALKLLFKEFIFVKNSYSIVFLFSPIIVLFLSFFVWSFIPLTPSGSIFNSQYSILWVLVITSVDVYIIFLSGFSSNSKYAVLGSIRSVVQMISYEVTFSLLIIPVIFLSGSFSLYETIIAQLYFSVSNYVYCIPNSFLVFICLLAETNRAPFDLPEAEAELVAGYNVEYSSLPFAFFFLGEYLNMIYISVLMVILFFSGWGNLYPFSDNMVSFFLFYVKVLFTMFVIVWVRATLPRMRYDSLMNFCWKYCLIFSISFIFFFVSLYTLLLWVVF